MKNLLTTLAITITLSSCSPTNSLLPQKECASEQQNTIELQNFLRQEIFYNWSAKEKKVRNLIQEWGSLNNEYLQTKDQKLLRQILEKREQIKRESTKFYKGLEQSREIKLELENHPGGIASIVPYPTRYNVFTEQQETTTIPPYKENQSKIKITLNKAR